MNAKLAQRRQFGRFAMEGKVPEVDFSAFAGEMSGEITERQREVGRQLYEILTTHGDLGGCGFCSPVLFGTFWDQGYIKKKHPHSHRDMFFC